MGSNFMQQFMAGWQMGQGRNENQRRDQELAMEQQRQQEMMQQRAQEFEMRKEEFALQKKRIAAQEAELAFNAKKEAAAMMSRNQQTLPPETQNLGDGTMLELGPATQERAPITAAIPGAPEGTPEVQMPFREDLEAQQLAERQQKMREALGLFNAQEGIKAKYREKPKGLAEIEAEAAARARGTRIGNPPGSGGSGGLTPTQEAAQIARLTKDWETTSKNSKEMKRQLSLMETGLSAAKRGDLAAGSQAVLVTFQKILDPTSVVRESEYARSAAGQSLLAQMEGKIEQLSKGGAGVPVSELEKYAALAREFTKHSVDSLKGAQERIGKTADRYKIPRDLIFGDEGSESGGAAPKATHRWSPQGGIVPIGGK